MSDYGQNTKPSVGHAGLDLRGAATGKDQGYTSCLAAPGLMLVEAGALVKTIQDDTKELGQHAGARVCSRVTRD